MNFQNYSFLQKYNLKDFEEKIHIYKDILQKFNRIHNLTHLKNIDQNIFDSIKILDFYDFSQAKNIADIGSGAGFPAIFLAFLLKNNFHLFEPNPKKAAFLRSVKIECKLNHLNVYKEKIQSYKNTLKADIITSRALMDVKPLLEICKKIHYENTVFILWKGSEIYKEIQGIKNYKIFENNMRKYCILK